MNAAELKAAGFVGSTRDLIAVALLDAGFTPDEAAGMISELEQGDRPAAPKAWTVVELEALENGLSATGWRLPSLKVIRALADQLDRTPKSVQSQMERTILAHQRELREALGSVLPTYRGELPPRMRMDEIARMLRTTTDEVEAAARSILEAWRKATVDL